MVGRRRALGGVNVMGVESSARAGILDDGENTTRAGGSASIGEGDLRETVDGRKRGFWDWLGKLRTERQCREGHGLVVVIARGGRLRRRRKECDGWWACTERVMINR